MTDPLLQMYLMACIVVAMAILLFWNQFRRKLKLNGVGTGTPEEFINYRRIKRVSKAYWVIFLSFCLMVVIYAVVPELYFVFLPMDLFHHPMINTVGLLVTKLSIAWIVVAQVHIDKELFKHSRDIDSLTAMELVWYSEEMLLSGMLVLFVGIFITITNVIGLLLTVAGLVFFFKRRITKAY